MVGVLALQGDFEKHKKVLDIIGMPNLFVKNEKDLNKRPEIQNLIGIYSSLKSQKITDTINEFQGKNFSNFKEKLSEVVIENISPISKEISKLKSDKAHILQVLKDGSEKAEAIASEKVKKIKEIIGF